MDMDILSQLGVGGLFCYVLVKEILNFLSSNKKDSEILEIKKTLEAQEEVLKKVSLSLEKLTMICEFIMTKEKR